MTSAVEFDMNEEPLAPLPPPVPKTTFLRIQGGVKKGDYNITKVEVEKIGIEEELVRTLFTQHMKEKCKKCAFCYKPATGFYIHKMSVGKEDTDNVTYVSFVYCALDKNKKEEEVIALFQRLIDSGTITDSTKK